MWPQFDDLAPAERFSSRAEHYAKHRPRYPPGVLEILAQEAGLAPSSVIADIGSGTGILSHLFLENRNTVFGVEPNEAMRRQAERLLSGWATFYSIPGAAEETTLPAASVDGIVAAQAFHWFDGPRAVAEFRRIARPGGFVALVWNSRKTEGSPFMGEYERIVRQFGSDFARSGRERVPNGRLRELFGPELRQRTLANSQELDWEGLRGRLLSASYMPLPGVDGHGPMILRLSKAFDEFQVNARVRLDYETQIYFAGLGS